MNDMKTKTNPTPPQLYRKLDRARRTAERAVTKMMGKEQGETHAGVVVWDRRIHAYFGFKPTPTTSLFGNDPELSEQAFVNAIRLAEINLSAAVNGLGSMNRDFESWLRTRQEDQQTVEAFTRQFKVPVVLDFSSDNNPLEFLALAWDLSDEDFHKQKFDPKQWASRARAGGPQVLCRSQPCPSTEFTSVARSGSTSSWSTERKPLISGMPSRKEGQHRRVG